MMKIRAIYDTGKAYLDDSDMLYHFTKAENACKILLEGRLNFSPLYRADDIKEYRLHTYIKQDFYHLTNREVEKFILDNCKSICFSSNYKLDTCNVEGINHPRMWAQYADNWRGVCFVFSKKAILENNRFVDEDFFRNVSYVSYFDEYDTINDTNKDKIEEYIRREKQKLFFEKHIDWASEHEVKLIYFGKEKSIDISESIEYICFGDRFLESGYYNAISKVLDFQNISYMQAEISSDDGNISATQIDFNDKKRFI